MNGDIRTSSCGWPHYYDGSWLKKTANNVLSLLFPPYCLLCGEATDAMQMVCDNCASELPSLEGARCYRCQGSLDDPSADLCRGCGNSSWGFDLARSLGPYNSGWGELVRALKFGRERAISRFLSARMASYLNTEQPFRAIDLITYVPMSRRALRLRGFNQARLLALSVGHMANIPVCGVLLKNRDTTAQATLSANKRKANLHGAFAVVKSGKERVLLIDDIYTTGSTVEECSRTLRTGGYRAIFVLTVARA